MHARPRGRGRLLSDFVMHAWPRGRERLLLLCCVDYFYCVVGRPSFPTLLCMPGLAAVSAFFYLLC